MHVSAMYCHLLNLLSQPIGAENIFRETGLLKGMSNLSSVTFRNLMTVTSFTLLRHLWISIRKLILGAFRKRISEFEILRIKFLNFKMILYLFSKCVKQRVRKKIQFEKKIFFLCFHFLNAPKSPIFAFPIFHRYLRWV